MRCRWTKAALRDFEELQGFIAQENPLAAQLIAGRVVAATKLLREQPMIGPVGDDQISRIWVVGRSPYVISYRVQSDCIWVLRLWHGRQNWRE